MRTLTLRTLLALSLLCLALPGGLRAQDASAGKKAEKEDPARGNEDEKAPAGRDDQRRRPDASGTRRINPMSRMFELMDPNGDGVITAKEMDEFIAKVDTDRDGRVNDDELRARIRSVLGELRPGGFSGRSGGAGGSGGRSRGGRQRRSLDDPRVSKESAEAANVLKKATRGGGLPGPGAVAPDFSLSLLEGSSAPDFVKPDGKGKVRLSGHKDKKPVVLIFGSYT